MTIINPNSISGISSITALNSTAAINLFKADGTSANVIAGITTGANFITGTSNVHSTGYECTNINASGIVTATELDISGNIDVDGHTNLDNVSIAGVTTFSNNVKFDGATAGRDVTFIRSSNTLEFASNAILELGNGGSGDCRLFNNGTDTRIINGNGTLKFESDTHEFRDKDNTTSYLTITSGGLLGLSNSSPGSQYYNNFVIGDGSASGDKGITIRTQSSNEGVIAFSDSNSGAARYAGKIAYNHGSNAMMFFTLNGDERLRINQNGKVIIGNNGTTFGNAAVQAFIQHGNTAGESGFSSVDTSSVAAGVGGEIAFHGKYNTGAQDYAYYGHIRGVKENATNGNTACALTFHTRPNATAPQERLRINSTGLVGINETSPDTHLHVNSGTYNGVATFESTDAYAHLLIKDNSTHANGTYFGVEGNDFRWITHNDSTSAERLRLTKMGSIQHVSGSGISYFNGASEYIFGSASSSPPAGGFEANVQIQGSKTRSHFGINAYMNNPGGPMMTFLTSRSGTIGTLGSKVQSNDYLGEMRFSGDNATNYNSVAHGATIWARAKSTPADGDTAIAAEINFSVGNANGGSVQDHLKIQGADGKIKFGPGLVHQLHSQQFSMHPDNGGNHITRLTFTGLQYGSYIAQIGYYNAAGQGFGGGCFHVSGYQTASYTYNVHEIVRWDNAGNSAISAVSKYNSSWVIDVTNTHGSYTGAGEVSVYGDAQVTCTITYHT